jgi:hypothetical protein
VYAVLTKIAPVAVLPIPQAPKCLNNTVGVVTVTALQVILTGAVHVLILAGFIALSSVPVHIKFGDVILQVAIKLFQLIVNTLVFHASKPKLSAFLTTQLVDQVFTKILVKYFINNPHAVSQVGVELGKVTAKTVNVQTKNVIAIACIDVVLSKSLKYLFIFLKLRYKYYFLIILGGFF